MIWILTAAFLLILPLRWCIAAVIAAAVHELGHYVAVRLCGVQVTGLHISITGARMEIGEITPKQEFICALAGPMAGLLLIPLSRWMPRTAVCALIHSVYNLLPVYPLDGGRILRALGAGEGLCRVIECICLISIFLTGLYFALLRRLGIFPILISLLTIHRAFAGKRLAIRRGIRYNRGRIYE